MCDMGHPNCRREACSELAAILAEQNARAATERPPPPEPAPHTCPTCTGNQKYHRRICPTCLGTGHPVKVEVTAEGKAVRVPSIGEAVQAGPRRAK